MKTLLVIDMQNDFINGALGTKEAEAIVPFVKDKIKEYREAGNPVFFTRDTHGEDYLDTQEGKNLPVKHCIEGTWGWQISDEIGFSEDDMVFDKNTFGWRHWRELCNQFEEIHIVGLVSNICVVTNALILKTIYPGAEIIVDASCCAGTTPQAHRAAMEVMKSCQITVIGE